MEEDRKGEESGRKEEDGIREADMGEGISGEEGLEERNSRDERGRGKPINLCEIRSNLSIQRKCSGVQYSASVPQKENTRTDQAERTARRPSGGVDLGVTRSCSNCHPKTGSGKTMPEPLDLLIACSPSRLIPRFLSTFTNSSAITAAEIWCLEDWCQRE